MIRSFTLLFLGLFLCTGCVQEIESLPSTPETADTTSDKGASSPAEQSSSSMLPIPESIEPTLADEQRPETTDAFQKMFLELYAEGPYKPFVELTQWEAATEEQKQTFLKNAQELVNFQGKTGTIGAEDVEFIPIDKHEYAYYPSNGDDSIEVFPKPIYVFGVKVNYGSSEAISMAVSDYMAVGEHNGKLYFCRAK